MKHWHAWFCPKGMQNRKYKTSIRFCSFCQQNGGCQEALLGPHGPIQQQDAKDLHDSNTHTNWKTEKPISNCAASTALFGNKQFLIVLLYLQGYMSFALEHAVKKQIYETTKIKNSLSRLIRILNLEILSFSQVLCFSKKRPHPLSICFFVRWFQRRVPVS